MPELNEREIEVFNVALELPAGQRAAYLEVACAGDAALRQRLEALLAAADQAGEWLPNANVSAKATMKLDVPAVPDDNVVGQLIGRYKLLEKVGEGGCGVVYVAQQNEPVRRRVALKVIKLGMDTKEVIARFEAERQALAMMDHPNIAKVLDAGTTETGRPYFVMELVRGIRITDYCDQNQLSTKERLDLFIKICHAIQHAHQKGIIHRDIKPSNILVTLHDGVPVPKVIDFGIAKATEGRLTDATVYTQLHQFIGTPAYMSPEQAEMSGLDIDTRSDIYSLGVLLYELLAGSTPFDAKKLMSCGLDAMRKIIREQEPVRPSTRFATLQGADLTTTAKRRSTETSKLLHQLRGDLDWIVMKCLEKDRTRRYETANGLSADLLRHINHEPVVARPPSNAYRFQKMVRRNQLACAAAVAVAVALLLGVVATIGAEREQTRLRKEAESEAIKARSEAERAKAAETVAQQRLAESEAISKFLKEVFQSPEPARDGRTITVVETLGAAAKRLDTQLADQPALRAKLQSTLGLTYRSLGLYRDAISLQEKVLDYNRAAFGPEHPETLMAMTELGNSYFADGRRDEALKLREQVLALFRKVSGPEHVDTLVAMNNLGNSYEEAGRQDEALELREQVLALRRKVSGPENVQTLRAMNNLANSYNDAGRQDEALKLREQVLTLRRKVIGPEHPETISAMQNLAGSYDLAGRREEALNLREQALTISRKVSGPEHPKTLIGMNELAISYDEAGRWDEALKLREQVLTLRRKVLGAVHPDTLAAMNDLARTLAASKSAEIRNGTNAMRLAEEAVAATHRTNPDFLDTLAAACAETGQFDRAVAAELEAVGLAKSEENKKDYVSRLKLYQANTPYRDSGNPLEGIKP